MLEQLDAFMDSHVISVKCLAITAQVLFGIVVVEAEECLLVHRVQHFDRHIPELVFSEFRELSLDSKVVWLQDVFKEYEERSVNAGLRIIFLVFCILICVLSTAFAEHVAS